MRFSQFKNAIYCLAVFGVGVLAQPAQAGFTTLTFHTVSNNNGTNVGLGESLLRVDVYSGQDGVAADAVAFKFYFNSAAASQPTITDIYFADGTLLETPPDITKSAGVVGFDQAATPQDLPSAPPSFQTSQFFTSAADNPQPSKGVNPGEYIIFTFDMKLGTDYNDILAAINAPYAGDPNNPVYSTSTLGLGLKVANFAAGGSETFVNDPVNPVPAPAGLVLALSCAPFLLVGRVIRRKLAAANA